MYATAKPYSYRIRSKYDNGRNSAYSLTIFDFYFSMLLQRTQTLSEERGQQLRDQRPPVGGYPQRHGHDASQADHQGREAQEKGENSATWFVTIRQSVYFRKIH